MVPSAMASLRLKESLHVVLLVMVSLLIQVVNVPALMFGTVF